MKIHLSAAKFNVAVLDKNDASILDVSYDSYELNVDVDGIINEAGSVGELIVALKKRADDAITAAFGANSTLCEDEGCPHAGTPHVCVNN